MNRNDQTTTLSFYFYGDLMQLLIVLNCIHCLILFTIDSASVLSDPGNLLSFCLVQFLLTRKN